MIKKYLSFACIHYHKEEISGILCYLLIQLKLSKFVCGHKRTTTIIKSGTSFYLENVISQTNMIYRISLETLEILAHLQK
jgi:hypothetical protein